MADKIMIDAGLRAKALEELAAKYHHQFPSIPESEIRKDAEEMFLDSYRLAIRDREKYVSLSTDKGVLDLYRKSIITLFTMKNGVSPATAEEIVDDILKK